GTGTAAASPVRVGRLRLSRRDVVRGHGRRLPHRRGAHHLRRTARRPVEDVQVRHLRVGAHAVACRAAEPGSASSARLTGPTFPPSYRYVTVPCSSMSEAPPQSPVGLSVFFPAYNDSGTIASMVVSALLAARTLTPDREIIVVNDGGRDATPRVLDELARVYPEVRIVHHAVNRGYGGALRSGFATATKDVVFYTDGDAQYDPSEMVLLWERLTPDVDLVNGYKISRSDPLHRIVIGRLYHHTVRTLFGLKVRDVDCDFRMM